MSTTIEELFSEISISNREPSVRILAESIYRNATPSSGKKQKPSDDDLNASKFSNSVEKLVSELDLSYLDAVTQCTDFYGLEFDAVSKFLTPHVMDKLRNESITARLIRSDSTVDALI